MPRGPGKGQKGKEGEREGTHMVLSLKLSWSQDVMGKYKVSLGNTRFLSFFIPALNPQVSDGLKGEEHTRSIFEACEKWG